MTRFVEGDDRTQSSLFPEPLNDYGRGQYGAIDVFVDELDLAGLGFEGVEPEAAGRPAYHPATLLKIYDIAQRRRAAVLRVEHPQSQERPSQHRRGAYRIRRGGREVARGGHRRAGNRLRQGDIPGLRRFRAFSRPRQGIIAFRNQ